MMPASRPWPEPPSPGKRRVRGWVKINTSTKNASPVAIQAATISLRTSDESTPLQATAPASAASTNSPSRPRILSITIEAMACVFLICIRTRNHQVEHIADEAQEHRRAQREPRLDHPDQKIPAHIRDEQAALEDQHTEYKQAEVERVGEDRANLVAVLPEHQPQKRERQRDQHKIDGRAEPGPLRSCPTGMVFSHRMSRSRIVQPGGLKARPWWTESRPIGGRVPQPREWHVPGP